MDTNNKKQRILKNLDDVEMESSGSSAAYAKQFLSEEGFNVVKEAEYADQYMRKVRFLVTAAANKTRDEELFQTAFAKIKDAIKENANKATDALLAMLQAKNPAFHYRKLENWTDDEIREVLSDIDLVKLMEELSKDK